MTQAQNHKFKVNFFNKICDINTLKKAKQNAPELICYFCAVHVLYGKDKTCKLTSTHLLSRDDQLINPHHYSESIIEFSYKSNRL